MIDAPATISPDRPSLLPADHKPDVLVRLRSYVASEFVRDMQWPEIVADMTDAIGAITGLRDSNETRLGLINEAKAERDQARARNAELEAELKAIRDAQTEGR